MYLRAKGNSPILPCRKIKKKKNIGRKKHHRTMCHSKTCTQNPELSGENDWANESFQAAWPLPGWKDMRVWMHGINMSLLYEVWNGPMQRLCPRCSVCCSLWRWLHIYGHLHPSAPQLGSLKTHIYESAGNLEWNNISAVRRIWSLVFNQLADVDEVLKGLFPVQLRDKTRWQSGGVIYRTCAQGLQLKWIKHTSP